MSHPSRTYQVGNLPPFRTYVPQPEPTSVTRPVNDVRFGRPLPKSSIAFHTNPGALVAETARRWGSGPGISKEAMSTIRHQDGIIKMIESHYAQRRPLLKENQRRHVEGYSPHGRGDSIPGQWNSTYGRQDASWRRTPSVDEADLSLRDSMVSAIENVTSGVFKSPEIGSQAVTFGSRYKARNPSGSRWVI